jgi:hypothetical protein
MRIFQNAGIYPAYLSRLNHIAGEAKTFSQRASVFLGDRYGACHFLLPVLQGHANAFFTNGDDEFLQRMWAREQGMASDVTLKQILLAQIEHHRADVFYNHDPMRYGSEFVRRLPGCVKHAVAWRAAPSPNADFGAYDVVVCNFPTILQEYTKIGWRSEYFSPAHDPEMNAYAANVDRPFDVVFVGGYSRHHRRRAEVLEAVSESRKHLRVAFYLDRSRLTRLAESPIGRLFPLFSHRRPVNIRTVSAEPVFGRDLYGVLSRAKVVLNGAVDMAGGDRGNMRCFEAMGCGALMVSDAGRYPSGMRHGENMLTYRNAEEAVSQIKRAVCEVEWTRQIARNGHELMRFSYDKATQWQNFQDLVGRL